MKLFFRRCLPSVFFLLCGIGAPAIYGQALIHGNVKNTDGMPIPGVNVQLAGTTLGTTTDFEGDFQLVVQAQDSLVVSYMGYVSQQLPVGTQTEFEIILQEDEQSLGELVINAGYYTTTERERTGNIAKVTAEEIELQPLVSPLQALQGRMAGVEITPNSDVPGAAPTIRIRGQNSLRSEGNYPLYIVDGMPLNSTPVTTNSQLSFSGLDPLSTLDLTNIKSIEVLKDADATAIYGSRGANGVVLITTKKGGGRAKLHAQYYMGVGQVPNHLELLGTSPYLALREQAFANDGVEPTEANAYDLLLWDRNRETDWQEVFLGGQAPITHASLSAEGGNTQTHYRLHGALHHQGSIYPVAMDYQKLTAGLQVGHRSKDEKLQLEVGVNYGRDANELLGGEVNFRSLAFDLPPNAPALFEDGELSWEAYAAAGLDHPLEGYYNRAQVTASQWRGHMQVGYRLWEDLRISTNLGYTEYHSEELIKLPKRSYAPNSNAQHHSITTDNRRSSWLVEPQLDYQHTWGKLKVQALVGGTLQHQEEASRSLEGQGYVAEALIGNLGAAEQLLPAQTREGEYRYMAGFARLGLQWDDRYYLNLTGRRDGSSRFGPGKRFANFGAVGAAWIFSEASFFKEQLDWLSLVKLRGSYGSTGNDQIGDYGYLDAYAASAGAGGLVPIALANADYSWEVNKKLEAGVQLGFWSDRMLLGVSWYRNRSSNQLVGYPLPSMTGFTQVQANLGATVENRGWEVEFSVSPFTKGKLRWRSAFNLTLPRNELVRYPGLESSAYAHTYRVGEPLNIAWLYRFEGLDPETGLYSVADVDGDSSYGVADRVVVQDRTRSYYGGWQNHLSYEGISLDFLWEFARQEGSFATLFRAGFAEAQVAGVASVLEGGSPYQTPSQSLAASQAYGRVIASDFVVETASYVRLKTLRLGYQVPAKFTQAWGMAQVNVFMAGQNLWTLSDYPGMDPARPVGGTSFGGLRMLTAGLALTF